MENTNIELTLNEISEELKSSIEAIRQHATSIEHLTERFNEFENFLKNQEIVVPQVETKSMERIVSNGLIDIASTVSNALKKVQSNNVKVFLESDKNWMVRIVLGVFLLTFLYFTGKALMGK